MQVPRLLNVAFSRSKQLFVVLADMGHIERAYKNRFLLKLLTTMLELQQPDEQLVRVSMSELKL